MFHLTQASHLFVDHFCGQLLFCVCSKATTLKIPAYSSMIYNVSKAAVCCRNNIEQCHGCFQVWELAASRDCSLHCHSCSSMLVLLVVSVGHSNLCCCPCSSMLFLISWILVCVFAKHKILPVLPDPWYPFLFAVSYICPEYSYHSS